MHTLFWRTGEINIGQRCREIFGAHNVFNIGFLTNRGTGVLHTVHYMCMRPHDDALSHRFPQLG